MQLFSKNKISLLKFFYSHPDRQFYIQEMGRLLGKKPGVFQRALNNLHDQGLLISEYKANARFFSINKNSPIYNELKSIISKSAKVCLIISLFSAVCSYANEKPLTLKDAILTAFENNKDIQMQEREIDAAKANILDANSRFLPKVNLEGSYTHNDKVLAENIFSGYNNDNQLALTFTESIYSGGANMANFKQARIGLNIQGETLRAKKLDVEFEAKRLYYGLLFAYENERIAREALGQSQAHYADVKNKFSQGTASRFDVLQSGVQVSLLMPALVKANNDVKLIKAELNKLLGSKIDTGIETEERLGYTHFEIQEQEFLKVAYLNKPEMILKALGVDINKWSIQMAKSGYRPKIDAAASYSYRSNNLGNLISRKSNNWNAGFLLNVPIFEGFSTKAQVDAAKARYFESILDKENVSDQIAVDVRQACLNLKEAEAIINSQKDHVDEAREALKIAEVSYDNGVGTNLDVLDAQVSLSQIQTNLASGIYDYLMAEASLKRNMGESFITEGKNEKKN
jgi:outer membrane protein TolC